MSYLKGKDIKTKGDCLVHCFTKRIEIFMSGFNAPANQEKPEGFERW